DHSQAVGRAISLDDTPQGLYARFKVARGAEGDKALQLAEDGVRDGLSVGIDGLDDGGAFSEDADGVNVVTRAALREITLTAMPAFDGARVDGVRMADAPPKPYGNVEYADPKHGKYPIDTEAHVRAAWSYINQADNASAYPMDGVTLAEVKARIMAA